MIYRMLGSTGEKVSAIGVGGWHLGLKHVDEKLAIRIVREAVDRGINFLDNSWDYNEGESEKRDKKKTLRPRQLESPMALTDLDHHHKNRRYRNHDAWAQRIERFVDNSNVGIKEQ